MREIKFRVWDTYNLRMITEPYYFGKRSEPDVEDERFNSPMVYAEDWQDVDDGVWRPCQLMQFTGLHDKNGKEIYEGDILKYVLPGEGPEEINMEYVEEVVFSDGQFCLDNYTPVYASLDWNCEVIGNIHENPELL